MAVTVLLRCVLLLLFGAIPMTLARGDVGLLASTVSSNTLPAVSASLPLKDLVPVLAAVPDQNRVSVSVYTLTIPGHVETSYITESARVTVVTVPASDTDSGGLPASTLSDSILTFSLPLTTVTVLESSNEGGGLPASTASDSVFTLSLPFTTVTALASGNEGSGIPTETLSNSISTLSLSSTTVTLQESSLQTTPVLTLSLPSTILTLQEPSPLPASTQDSTSTIAATVPAASEATAVTTNGLPPTVPTAPQILTTAPVVDPIYSLFTSFPSENGPRVRYNASSSIIPVWSPELLGYAYGGGLVHVPTVFALVQPEATGTLRGIPPAYGYTVFPLVGSAPATTAANGTNMSGNAYGTYPTGGSPSAGLYDKDPSASTAAVPSGLGLLRDRFFPGNGSYQAMDAPSSIFEISIASKDVAGMATLAASILLILAIM